MEIISIGKGMFRVTVRSPKKRMKLAGVPGVTVSENRVIFGEEMRGPVMDYLGRKHRKKAEKPIQLGIEW